MQMVANIRCQTLLVRHFTLLPATSEHRIVDIVSNSLDERELRQELVSDEVADQRCE